MENNYANSSDYVSIVDVNPHQWCTNTSVDGQRYQRLTEEFTKLYGEPPQFITRAPGRVNLIGEHIDYAEFGVLPVALDRDIIIACARNDTSTSSIEDNTAIVHVAVHSPRCIRRKHLPYENLMHRHSMCSDVDATQHRWSNYVKCGIRGVVEHVKAANINGMNILVDGTIPPGAGLSSSSAMVVASALATMAINNWRLTKSELAIMCTNSERYVGTNGGGMDQTCSLFAKEEHALFIRFQPTLSATPIPLPHGSAIVIIDSLVVSEKVAAADYQFNIRVLETRLAARVLAHSLGLYLSPANVDIANADKSLLEECTLRSVAQEWLSKNGYGSSINVCENADALELFLSQVDIVFKRSPYTLEEAAAAAGITVNELSNTYLTRFPVRISKLKLYDRAYHVYSEAARVCRFRQICMEIADQNVSLDQQQTSKQLLGELMNQSQTSCRDYYECSCPELDLLTDICRKYNAYGARLTGAGWGGCCIALVAADQATQFLTSVSTEYYAKHGGLVHLDTRAFVCHADAGACIYQL
ncbi:ribosomal protein S5 domain 2-type protein [Syncephalis plumigaleata]|nr:ribosomal protein S5 domain 2-type protein [Syncephalis plumigaleata]